MATVLASLLSSGSVSWLFYADRVAQFPIGIFSIALASVLLPALSNASARQDTATFNKSLSDSLRFTSFFIIPMAAGIWSLALPIIQVLFERGAFTHDSSIKTSHALEALALGLWASSCHSMLIRAFIAKKDTITPTGIGACSLIINVCASLLLIGPLSLETGTSRFLSLLRNLQTSLLYVCPFSSNLGHVGLALASSIAACGSLLLVVVMFNLKMKQFPWRVFLVATLKALLATLVMILGIKYGISSTQQPLMQCLYGTMWGIASFVVVSYLLRSRELLDTLGALKRRVTTSQRL
jgi:putative peptidoglycan lipid II flippase